MIGLTAEGFHMSDPIHPQPRTGGDRLRSLENDRASRREAERLDSFVGLREIDQALSSNNLTSYSVQKFWRDPLARMFAISGLLAIAAGWTYLAFQ